MDIKICGIKEPETAYQTARLGAQYIGIIFHSASPRYVAPTQATAIAKAAIAGGAKPVAVFTEHDANMMQHICTITGIKTVQLQGQLARAQHHLLPKHYQRIYVQSVDNTGQIMPIDLTQSDPNRDFLLFDAMHGGSGKSFPHNQFNYSGHFRWCLAGGLHSKNVSKAIQQLQPSGVDVSSGVETIDGQKSLTLIKQFIDTVHSS